MSVRRSISFFVVIIGLMAPPLASADPDLPPPPIFSGPENRVLRRLGDPPRETPPISPSGKPAQLSPSSLGTPRPLVARRDVRPKPAYANAGVANSVPVVSIETTAPVEINLGKTIPFVITVKNLGDSIATHVIVQAKAPSGAKVVGSNPPMVELENGQLQFELGDLPAKSKKQLTVHVTAQQAGNIDLAAQVKFSTQTGLTVAVRQPKLSIERVGPDEVVYGETLKQKIIVTNTGDGPAENVSVTARMPAGLKIIETPGRSGHLGTLAVGESRQVEISTIVQSTGRVTLDFLASGDGIQEVSTSQPIQVLRPMIEVDAKGPVLNYLKRFGVYSIVVSNPGDAPATNVQIENRLPEGLSVVAVEKAANYKKSERMLIWKIDALPAGQQETIRLRVEATGEGHQIQQIVVRADDGLMAEADHQTDIISRADLSMAIADTAGPVEVGKEARYEITVENRGTTDAENVVVKVLLPEAMYAVDAEHSPDSKREVRFPPLKVPAGGKSVLRLSAVSKASGDQIVRVIMQSDWLSRELIMEESIFFYNSETSRRIATKP